MPWSVRRLYDSTVKVSPSRRHYVSSKSRDLENVVPYPRMKSCLFQFTNYGLTVQALHQINLMFNGLRIETQEMPADDYIKIAYKGGMYWVQKPNYLSTPLLVRCSCPDFYFTFGYWNWTARALFGPKPRPYKRKTFNRPSRNPGKHAGMCKHIANCLMLMQTQGWTAKNVTIPLGMRLI